MGVFEKELKLGLMIYNVFSDSKTLPMKEFVEGAEEIKDTVRTFRNSDERTLCVPILHGLKMYKDYELDITNHKYYYEKTPETIKDSLGKVLRKYGKIR